MIESVRCLECGAVYAKPAGGGTVNANPGCPECGYVGWLSAAIPFTAGSARRHFGADRPRRRSA
jgi:predicted  nucleic acid-binding Zn-ribbon protein